MGQVSGCMCMSRSVLSLVQLLIMQMIICRELGNADAWVAQMRCVSIEFANLVHCHHGGCTYNFRKAATAWLCSRQRLWDLVFMHAQSRASSSDRMVQMPTA